MRGRKRKHDETKVIIDEKNIVQCQSIIRGYLARKDYHIPFLDKSERSDYDVLFVGNDPELKGIKKYKAKTNKIAFIGTSGMRSILLACELSAKETLPKLIIVDNSDKVVNFWRAFRDFAQNYKAHDNYFLTQFKKFLSSHLGKPIAALHPHHNLQTYSTDSINYVDQDPVHFMQRLIDHFGVDRVISIVKSVTILPQKWENPELWPKLKNILDICGIKKVYLYPSNIASCLCPHKSQLMLQNIADFNPSFVIHTDLCFHHRLPERTFFFKNNHPHNVAASLFGERKPIEKKIRN